MQDKAKINTSCYLALPEGMPGSGGYREHDILVVTEDGADNITSFPYGPDHNIVAG